MTKTPGLFDPHYVMHQLHCNGILNSVHACRHAFPIRLTYVEFKQRFGLLLALNMTMNEQCADAKRVTGVVLEKIGLTKDHYRLGLTKIFFRLGVIGMLEEVKEAGVHKIITMLQAQFRMFLVRKKHLMPVMMFKLNMKKLLGFQNWDLENFYAKVRSLIHLAM